VLRKVFGLKRKEVTEEREAWELWHEWVRSRMHAGFWLRYLKERTI
jgi:hypothetical protein